MDCGVLNEVTLWLCAAILELRYDLQLKAAKLFATIGIANAFQYL